ncbi:MAG TPA: RNA-binding domain-containing protein, partial [Acidiferrobacteraceae bacterium]|nr:RNA-binding domain-containing protein [Acidiferrobacteraceae bacterium]
NTPSCNEKRRSLLDAQDRVDRQREALIANIEGKLEQQRRVAFANTAGGTLLLGVEDKTRHIRGVADPLAVEERLASLVSDSILPRLVPELEILPWRRTHVVAVQVYPSSGRPHYLKRAGLDAGVYVRVGSTNRRADRELIEELRRFARGEAYDEQVLPEFDLAPVWRN